jgi:hypothetical protein
MIVRLALMRARSPARAVGERALAAYALTARLTSRAEKVD